MPTVYTYQFLKNNQQQTGNTTMTVAHTIDTLQSLTALDAENQLALHRNNLQAVADAIVAKQNADKTELSAQQVADNVAALNLIAGLQVQVTEALAKADVLGSAELAQIEASFKAAIEANPSLLSGGAGAVSIGGVDYTTSSSLSSLFTAPKVLKREHLYNAANEIVGAKLSMHDGLSHIFTATSVIADGVKTVTFENASFYNSVASYECKFIEVAQSPIIANGLTINLGSKWLAKSHTNIQVQLANLVAYVAPDALVTPDLNSDGVIGSLTPQ